MSRKDYNKYFEVLEVPPNASLPEVRRSYRILKELYSTESIVTVPVEDDLPEERRKEIIREIEHAYFKLLPIFEQKKNTLEYKEAAQGPDGRQEKAAPEIEASNGPSLRKLRERLGIVLHDVALATNIQVKHLENIETEKFDALPADIYTRGFVISYAKYLSLDSKKFADDYMKRYREWKREIAR